MSTDLDPADHRQERVHMLNAYTWAGRRGTCGVTSNFLPSAHDRSEVTCADCLAVLDREGLADPSRQP